MSRHATPTDNSVVEWYNRIFKYHKKFFKDKNGFINQVKINQLTIIFLNKSKSIYYYEKLLNQENYPN